MEVDVCIFSINTEIRGASVPGEGVPPPPVLLPRGRECRKFSIRVLRPPTGARNLFRLGRGLPQGSRSGINSALQRAGLWLASTFDCAYAGCNSWPTIQS